MSQISPVLRSMENNHLSWWCPGCKELHAIQYGDGSGPRWGWDGNESAPTFTPSVLVRSGHHTDHHKPGDPCWCTFNAEDKADGTLKPGEAMFTCNRCHCFIRAGQIEFLGDCSHHLANQTVPMVELDSVRRAD